MSATRMIHHQKDSAYVAKEFQEYAATRDSLEDRNTIHPIFTRGNSNRNGDSASHSISDAIRHLAYSLVLGLGAECREKTL